MVSIILLSYNKWEVTKACIESIKENVSIPYEIILVDNASKEETVNELKKISGINAIFNEVNTGFPGGCNLGLKAAKGDYIWFLNNDTIVPKNSLERMVEILENDKTIGCLGPVTNNISGIQKIPVPYKDDIELFDDTTPINDFTREVLEKYNGQMQRVIRLVGFSMLIPKNILDTIGGFDERMGIGTFEDDDLSLRIVANGYKLFIAQDCFLHHIGNVSFKAAGGYEAVGSNGFKNQCIVSTTYEMTVPDETTIDEDFVSMVNPKKNILHIECGAGAYGLRMQELGKYIVGLDSTVRKLNVAQKHYNEFYNYEIDKNLELPLKTDFFDTVICEKQLNNSSTETLFRELKKYIKNDGEILIQIPKIIGNHDNILDTYLDKWDCEEGHIPLHGKFNSNLFLKNMELIGYEMVEQRESDLIKGFFNRNAFTRHLTDYKPKESDYEFFKEMTFKFKLK